MSHALEPPSQQSPDPRPWDREPGLTSPNGLIPSEGEKPAASIHDASNYSHKYGSPYEATLNSADGRETMGSPGLESVQHMDTEKETYRPAPYHYPNYGAPQDRARHNTAQKRKICGMPLWLLITILALFIALAVGLGAGLGVGLSNNDGSTSSGASGASTPSPRPTGSTSSSPNDFSTSGVFNGTGLALATQSFGQDNYGTVVVYFQHWTGSIRTMQLGSDGSWGGGDETDIVAVDARNGTPIAAVAYAMEEVSTWHIFYIDTNDTLQETINGNTTNQWQPGPLGDYGFKAMNDPHVALQGCWEGYRPGGQINAVPIEGTGETYSDSSQTRGISLWYGSDSTTLQSLSWTFGTETWSKEEAFEGFNAHAGIGCYSWGPGTVTYLMASDLSNTVNIWWKDLNQTATGTSSHPIGQWVNSSAAITNAFQNTSLGYTEFLYAQDSALNLVGYNVSWDAEATSFVPDDQFSIKSNVGIPGTRMTVTATPNDSGGQNLLVFNQNEGDTITEYTRDLYAGQWTSYTLDVPT